MKTASFLNLYSKFADSSVNTIHFDCTYRCNLNCRHCYQIKDVSCELATADIKRILSELKQNNCFEVNFSGGEPFLRDDFLEIVQFAADLDFKVCILTNATLIDRSSVEKLSKLSKCLIQPSLYGIKADTHDFFTRVKGSFDKTIRAISLLEKHGIKFNIAFLVMKHNFFEAQIFKNIAKKKKWNAIFEHIIMPTADRKLFPLEYRITDEQASLVLDDKLIRQQFIRPTAGRHAGIFIVGKYMAYIAPDGEVYPNCSLRLPCGNLKERSFSDVWHNSKVLNRLRERRIEEFECFTCSFFDRCLSGPPWIFMEEGELTQATKEACRFTRLAIAKENKLKKRRFGHEKGK